VAERVLEIPAAVAVDVGVVLACRRRRSRFHRGGVSVELPQERDQALVDGGVVAGAEGCPEPHFGHSAGNQGFTEQAADLFEELVVDGRCAHHVHPSVVDAEGAKREVDGGSPGELGQRGGVWVQPFVGGDGCGFPGAGESVGDDGLIHQAELEEQGVERPPVDHLLLRGVLELTDVNPILIEQEARQL
jgi:hypothetical protein